MVIIATEGLMDFVEPYLFLLLIVCIISMVFAILTTRPRIATLQITKMRYFNE